MLASDGAHRGAVKLPVGQPDFCVQLITLLSEAQDLFVAIELAYAEQGFYLPPDLVGGDVDGLNEGENRAGTDTFGDAVELVDELLGLAAAEASP
jgi:hypothetical protein